MRFALAPSLLVALALAPRFAGAQESVKIPLKDVWAFDMPGTKPMTVNMRDSAYISDEGPILIDLMKTLETEDPPWPGFVVVGEGLDALRKCSDAMKQRKGPSTQFSTADSLTLFFFTLPRGGYVHFDKIVRAGRVIEVRYRFVPHQTRDASVHLALIPPGQLPSGDYDVHFVQSKMDKKFAKWGFGEYQREWEKRVICKDFGFEVVDDL